MVLQGMARMKTIPRTVAWRKANPNWEQMLVREEKPGSLAEWRRRTGLISMQTPESQRFPYYVPAPIPLGASAETIARINAANEFGAANYPMRMGSGAGGAVSKVTSIDPRSGLGLGAGSGIAAGGTALARGGPSVGTAPGAGLSLGGVSSGITGGVSSIGGTLSNVGSGIMNTVTPLIPLAVKVVLAVVIIKVALALFRKR